ncbi:cupredoxin domain-containing protein [Oceanobacillus profundus]|uniref:cupredoxin domain-containing protein n=1 Tax=Oceanobacillus profundus TaxID=372463 RepID=UPI00203CA027|nr:cupredoxin domain-containing protein [Oceanobacillus profundus]MCM3400392.1 cupredoxin domain-containing protein [Oceanobacillus profundus]
MSIKKSLAGLLALMMVMSISVPLHVFAASGAGTEPMEPVNEMMVELHDDFFNLDVITIASGESTELLLENVGQKQHTFTVEKLGIDVELQPGEQKTITIEPQEGGTYELICRFHENEGMVGEVIIK